MCWRVVVALTEDVVFVAGVVNAMFASLLLQWDIYCRGEKWAVDKMCLVPSKRQNPKPIKEFKYDV